MRLIAFAITMILLWLISGVAAMGQDTTIELPYGNVLASLIGLVGIVLVILLGVALRYLVKFLPPWAQAVISQKQLEEIQAYAADAIEFGVQKTQDAVKGKEIDVNVGNEIVAHAAQEFIDTAEAKVVDALGSDGVKLAVIKGLEKANVILPADSTVEAIMASPEVSSVTVPANPS
jgi:hypothetical protein